MEKEATIVDAISPAPADPTQTEAWSDALWLPCQLQVDLVMPSFTIGDLLRLEAGSILDSQWKQNTDVPLRVNGLVIAYAEFEVIGDRSAVRVTEIL